MTKDFSIQKEYFNYLVEYLANDGYIENINIINIYCAEPIIMLDDNIRITPKVIEYLTEKSIVLASYGANILTDCLVHVKLHCPKDTHLFVTKNKRESEVLFHDGLTYEFVSTNK